MKKSVLKSSLLAGVIGVIAVVGVACGVPQDDFDALATRVTDAEGDVESIQSDVAALQALAGMLAPGGMIPTTPAPTTPAPTTPAPAVEARLDLINERGNLICGVQSGTPGFGTLERVGHDVDYCRAIAAAIFGEVTSTNLEFVNATGSDRFELLAQGNIDVLVRTTTWTSGRDSNLGAAFTATTFYDQFGMMVPAATAANVNTANDLDGLRVCSRPGTSTLDAIEDFAEQVGIEFDVVSPEGDATVVSLYQAGSCDILGSDQSQLAGIRSELPAPLNNSVILSGGQLATEAGVTIRLAKEPLGPSTHESGGFEWFDLVQWVNYGLITAEEQGITQANVAARAASSDNTPVAQRVLGLSDNGFTDELVGKLENGQRFMQDVLAAVGNYGEIYERNLGDDGIGLDRACTAQALWFTADNAPGSADWQDCDGNGTITLEENRGLIYAPRYSG